MDMRAHRWTGRNVIMEFAFSLVQVNRFHADRKNLRCFSYERVDNFQVKMVEAKLEIGHIWHTTLFKDNVVRNGFSK